MFFGLLAVASILLPSLMVLFLDNDINFGTATVNVVPEPTSMVIFGLGCLLVARRVGQGRDA